ncbi:MAG: acyl carrier protein [Fulvimonas sp.]|jgi:acyl carrier protein|nr:acyl carrier protein [Fulvimonas sp.]
MDYQYILSQLIDILTSMTAGNVTIGEYTELAGQLALDSLRVMDLMLGVEDRLDCSIPINALAEVKTVGDLATQIQKYAGPTP